MPLEFQRGQVVGICLKNFRGVQDLVVLCTPGTNYFLAPNGFGKSSVFYALALALGSTRQDLRDVNSLIYEGASECDVSVAICTGVVPRSVPRGGVDALRSQNTAGTGEERTLGGADPAAAPSVAQAVYHSLFLFFLPTPLPEEDRPLYDAVLGNAGTKWGDHRWFRARRGMIAIANVHLARGSSPADRRGVPHARPRSSLDASRLYSFNSAPISQRRLQHVLHRSFSIAVDNPFQSMMQVDAQRLSVMTPQQRLGHFLALLRPDFSRRDRKFRKLADSLLADDMARVAALYSKFEAAAGLLRKAKSDLVLVEDTKRLSTNLNALSVLTHSTRFLRACASRRKARAEMALLQKELDGLRSRNAADKEALERLQAEQERLRAEVDSFCRQVERCETGIRNSRSALNTMYSQIVAQAKQVERLVTLRKRREAGEYASWVTAKRELEEARELLKAEKSRLADERTQIQSSLQQDQLEGIRPDANPQLAESERRVEELQRERAKMAQELVALRAARFSEWFGYVDSLVARAARERGLDASPAYERPFFVMAPVLAYLAVDTSAPVAQTEAQRIFWLLASRAALFVLTNDSGLQSTAVDGFQLFQDRGGATKVTLQDEYAGLTFEQAEARASAKLEEMRRTSPILAQVSFEGTSLRPGVAASIFPCSNFLTGSPIAILQVIASFSSMLYVPGTVQLEGDDIERIFRLNRHIRGVFYNQRLYSVTMYDKAIVGIQMESLATVRVPERTIKLHNTQAASRGGFVGVRAAPFRTMERVDQELKMASEELTRLRTSAEERLRDKQERLAGYRAQCAEVTGKINAVGRKIADVTEQIESLSRKLSAYQDVTAEDVERARAVLVGLRTSMARAYCGLAGSVGAVERLYYSKAGSILDSRAAAKQVADLSYQIRERSADIASRAADLQGRVAAAETAALSAIRKQVKLLEAADLDWEFLDRLCHGEGSATGGGSARTAGGDAIEPADGKAGSESEEQTSSDDLSDSSLAGHATGRSPPSEAAEPRPFSDADRAAILSRLHSVPEETYFAALEKLCAHFMRRFPKVHEKLFSDVVQYLAGFMRPADPSRGYKAYLGSLSKPESFKEENLQAYIEALESKLRVRNTAAVIHDFSQARGEALSALAVFVSFGYAFLRKVEFVFQFAFALQKSAASALKVVGQRFEANLKLFGISGNLQVEGGFEGVREKQATEVLNAVRGLGVPPEADPPLAVLAPIFSCREQEMSAEMLAVKDDVRAVLGELKGILLEMDLPFSQSDLADDADNAESEADARRGRAPAGGSGGSGLSSDSEGDSDGGDGSDGSESCGDRVSRASRAHRGHRSHQAGAPATKRRAQSRSGRSREGASTYGKGADGGSVEDTDSAVSAESAASDEDLGASGAGSPSGAARASQGPAEDRIRECLDKLSDNAILALVQNVCNVRKLPSLSCIDTLLGEYKPSLTYSTRFAGDETLTNISLSGGERSIVSLCLVNAIDGRKCGIHMRIIDEINQGMDDTFEKAAHRMIMTVPDLQSFVGSPKLPSYLAFPSATGGWGLCADASGGAGAGSPGDAPGFAPTEFLVHIILRRPMLFGGAVTIPVERPVEDTRPCAGSRGGSAGNSEIHSDVSDEDSHLSKASLDTQEAGTLAESCRRTLYGAW